MEVYQQVQSVLCRALTDLRGGRDIIIAAAVAVAVTVIGVVPHADADGVDAVVGKYFEDVLPIAVAVAEDHA